MIDVVKIEVDGKELEARKGQMLIEVTDDNDIYIPRFCYHRKLSVAANCRMCLVEVEKMPKPLPACATPVMDGMVVHTRSTLAVEAQRGVMEFLLINHPLDCPICDQGGECELQDLAIDYGSDISRYQENKRVVQDKDIGSLIQTDMTRCIHCTRCVRFGEEIAGLRELGATGRGEHMEIGTYVARSVVSELSGNVIDLCPVGALTSKPFRYTARAWELTQKEGIAPHDAVGSRLFLHCRDEIVKRVVPAPCESINEVWLSDRDRFSYQGLGSAERLLAPQIKQQDGSWREVDWQDALVGAQQRLAEATAQHGMRQLGVLAHASQTLEDLYALQKFARGVGCHNIDHRVHQRDFADQDTAPPFPYLNQRISDLEQQQAVLLIGSYLRKEQPMLNHRLRKAVMLGGARVSLLNMLDHDFNYAIADKWIQPPATLAAPLSSLLELAEGGSGAAAPDARCQRVLASLRDSEERRGTILLGNMAQAHPQFSFLYRLAARLAALTGARLACPGPAANSAGAWLAGVLPHRLPGGKPSEGLGLDAWQQLAQPRRAYLIMGLEPELDCWDGAAARAALQGAESVVMLTPFVSEAVREYADVLLPVPPFAENGGHLVNCEGLCQGAAAAVRAAGEAKPAWKVLRMLAEQFAVRGFDWPNVAAVLEELRAVLGAEPSLLFHSWAQRQKTKPGAGPGQAVPAEVNMEPATTDEAALQRITLLPMHAVDGLVRRAPALQAGGDCADGAAHINAATAERRQLAGGDRVRCVQQGSVALPVMLDEQVPDDCVLIHAGQRPHARLGGSFDDVRLVKQ